MISDKLSRWRKCLAILINIQELIIKYGQSDFLLAEKEKVKNELQQLRVNIIS